MKKIKMDKKNILILILLIAAFLVPKLIDRPYFMAIFVLTVYYACGSLAWSILGGMLGQISLGHAAFGALGAYVAGVFFSYYGISPWIAMIIAFFVVGGLMTLLITPCFELKGAYFSLATIAFGEAFRNLFTNWKYVGSGQGIMLKIVKDESLWMLAFKSKTAYYYVGLVMAIVFYIIIKLIDNSKLGYGLKTIREDEGTAMAIGINPVRYKMLATFISCGMVAVTGVFYACYIRYISPDIMTQSASLEFVLPAVIGGLSTVEGPVLGALIITPLSQYLNSVLGSVLPGSNLIVYSLVLIIVILVQPAGIMGWYRSKKQKALISSQRKELEE